MKKFILLIFVGLAGITYSQNINGRFSSSLYAFERFDTSEVSNNHLRSYQMLSLNINEGLFSIRSYMNLENDFSQDIIDDPRVRFYNLYVEARNLLDFATIKFGRQPLFNNIGGGLFDGLNIDLKKDRYKISAYYGGNVPAYQKLDVTDSWKDDFVFGGKLSALLMKDLQLSLGYINKNFKPYEYQAIRLDEDLNPINVLIRSKSNQFKFATAELNYDRKKLVSFDTRFDYDLNFEKTSKLEISGSYLQVKNFRFNVYYNYLEPRIRYNSIFSVFDFGNTQEIEGGVDYDINDQFTVSGKYGNVSYKDENSGRLGLGLISALGTLNFRKTFGYAGEMDALSLYTARTFLEGVLTPSLGLAYTSYKLSEDSEKNNLTTLLLGVNVRPWRSLSFDVQGQYMNNKIYKNDYRFFFRLNYWFNTNLNVL